MRENLKGGRVIESLVPPPIDLRTVGRHMPRPRSQRGWLSDTMPKRGKLPRGRFFARWRVYFRGEDGAERSKKAGNVTDARKGPLTRA